MKRSTIQIFTWTAFFSIMFSQKTVAVLDFDANNVSKSDVRAFSDRLREELFKTNKYKVLERSLMEEIMKEQKFQLSGCVSNECIVEVGQLTGVEAMVGGSVSKVGSVFTVSSRIIDVESGEITNMSSYDHVGDIGELLTNGIKIVAIELSSGKTSDKYDGRFESKTNIKFDEINPVYPARSLVRSLVIPGWGQFYNKSSWWKPVLFAGVEIAGIAGWQEWKKKAENLRLDYESYADSHWNIYDWIVNTNQLQEILLDTLVNMGYDWAPDVKIIGTHHLDVVYDNQIFLSDCLYDVYWSEEGSESDCILPNTPEEMDEDLYNSAYIPTLINNGEVTVIKDRDYYENIGKYDQFAGGWDGILDNYIIQFKDVGDTTEIIITSPIKNNYLSQREKSNDYLNMASYAVSAIMFNHILSAFEAVWTSTRRPGKTQPVESSMKLIYDKHARYGIGGLSFSVQL